ncbi:MAG: heme ABC exporter ATP-binding protein CcmA [Actinomycetota bacterium]|nr:heme ABC exporter ATP-binding protein CcmA [Actinomycetota bacterium]
MTPVIRLHEAVSLSDRFPLLAGVTLEVAEGEVVHLRGPNGAGKSSLLRACAGLEQVVSGVAVVLGHDLCTDRVSVRREVGLLGHATSLYDELTVEQNLRFAVRAARAAESGVASSIERCGLGGRLRATPVRRLSAGQRRRVAVAVLVARRPRLWLLDEPHAGLDADGRDLVDELVREASGSGATVVVASHELDRASAVADRVVVVSGGRVLEDEGTRGESRTRAACAEEMPGAAARVSAMETGVGGREGRDVA